MCAINGESNWQCENISNKEWKRNISPPTSPWNPPSMTDISDIWFIPKTGGDSFIFSLFYFTKSKIPKKEREQNKTKKLISFETNKLNRSMIWIKLYKTDRIFNCNPIKPFLDSHWKVAVCGDCFSSQSKSRLLNESENWCDGKLCLTSENSLKNFLYSSVDNRHHFVTSSTSYWHYFE